MAQWRTSRVSLLVSVDWLNICLAGVFANFITEASNKNTLSLLVTRTYLVVIRVNDAMTCNVPIDITARFIIGTERNESSVLLSIHLPYVLQCIILKLIHQDIFWWKTKIFGTTIFISRPTFMSRPHLFLFFFYLQRRLSPYRALASSAVRHQISMCHAGLLHPHIYQQKRVLPISFVVFPQVFFHELFRSALSFVFSYYPLRLYDCPTLLFST